jgi:hypothetical protein
MVRVQGQSAGLGSGGNRHGLWGGTEVRSQRPWSYSRSEFRVRIGVRGRGRGQEQEQGSGVDYQGNTKGQDARSGSQGKVQVQGHTQR